MTVRAERVELPGIQSLRSLFLQELNAQVRFDACHSRGWADSYLLKVDDASVGYGSVKGRREPTDRDAIFEFFVAPPFRKLSGPLFRGLVDASGASFVQCQSNDTGLSALLHEFCRDIAADVVLFADLVVTEYVVPGAIVRRRFDAEIIFPHAVEPVGEFVVDLAGDIVATGGFMLHYNVPFADLYMEVREDQRRRGFATLLLQEVKKECYVAGRVPAARTSLDNLGSRAALRKAGLRECGLMLTGTLIRPSARA